MDDILDFLSGAQWFTTLDLASGYWQVKVDLKDREKTAFTTNHGLHQFCVMPFGLTNVRNTFQQLMELVLAGLPWETCLAYLDDVIVFGRTFDEHLQRLSQALSCFRRANLKVNLTKCQFFKKSVSFLGHVISYKGIETDPNKTEAVRNWPPPENIEDLCRFLGLATYYQRSTPDYIQRENRHILVVSDNFTHWAKAYPVPNQEGATADKVFVDQWICQFGAPNVHSDKGRNFESFFYFRKSAKVLKLRKPEQHFIIPNRIA